MDRPLNAAREAAWGAGGLRAERTMGADRRTSPVSGTAPGTSQNTQKRTRRLVALFLAVGAAFVLSFAITQFANAAAGCIASSSGNWSATSGVWTSCEGGGGTSPPALGDTVTVNSGVTLTV